MNRYGGGATGATPQAVRRRRGLEGHPLIEQARTARQMLESMEAQGISNPYFMPHTGVNGATIDIRGAEMINFSGYNYLGLAGHPRVVEAAKRAIDQYGTSASASRIVSGEVAVYAEFEQRLAAAYGVAEAIVTPSGYLTNAAAIPFLLTPADVAVCDEFVHSSVHSGVRWAQCRRVTFRHNDPESLAAVLRRSRNQAERALVVVEAVYSMDGDIAPLPEIISVAREYDCLIMVDEAHSFGTLGKTGLGVREHFGLPGDAVDLWMGTLSKTLAGCGGFLAGNGDLMWALRFGAPGISMFTAPPTPAQIAASTAAFDVMRQEPDRVARLRANASAGLSALRAGGWNTGTSYGTPVVPIILGDGAKAIELSTWLLRNGVNAGPVLVPAVEPGQERIRLFFGSEHTSGQITTFVDLLEQYRSMAR
jgi:7-keto-8-aminopelargonate synthetase-like enzyme